MKRFQITILTILIIGCQTKKETSKPKEVKPETKTTSFFVGTYTDTISKGIYSYSLSEDGKLKKIGLAAVSENPSFLTKTTDNKFLLVVNETNDNNGSGTIESFHINGDSLTFISKSPSGGAHPCFVTVNKNGNVLIANYTGGNIGLLQLSSEGKLSDLLDIQQHTGKGTKKQQNAPHAHSAWFEANNTSIISVDLGTDELWFSKIDTIAHKLQFTTPKTLKMEVGAGPRHLSFHPNGKWMYVINELNSTVSLLEKNKNNILERKTSFSTLPKDYSEESYCADIHISSDGKFLYASNRGHNSIAIFKILEDGSLQLTAHQSVHGKWPRNFALSPNENFIIVANQHSSNLVAFKRDKKTGLLEFTDEINAPSAVCILF